MTRQDEIALDFAGNDYTATILPLGDGFMLTIRQKRGRWFKRRRFDSVGDVQDEMWMYDTRWRVA